MNLNILSDDQLAQLSQLISGAQNIIITCHTNADGDAIGSSLGWAEYLTAQGKDVTVIVPDQFPDFLMWMPNTEKIIRYDKHKDKGDMASDGELFGAHEISVKADFRIDHEDGLGKDVGHKHVAKHAEQEDAPIDVEAGRGLAVGSGEERKHVDIEAPSSGLRREVGFEWRSLVSMENQRHMDNDEAHDSQHSGPHVVFVGACRCLELDGLGFLCLRRFAVMLLLACHYSCFLRVQRYAFFCTFAAILRKNLQVLTLPPAFLFLFTNWDK